MFLGKNPVSIQVKKNPAERQLNHSAVATEASANPLRSSGAGVAIRLSRQTATKPWSEGGSLDGTQQHALQKPLKVLELEAATLGFVPRRRCFPNLLVKPPINTTLLGS